MVGEDMEEEKDYMAGMSVQLNLCVFWCWVLRTLLLVQNNKAFPGVFASVWHQNIIVLVLLLCLFKWNYLLETSHRMRIRLSYVKASLVCDLIVWNSRPQQIFHSSQVWVQLCHNNVSANATAHNSDKQRLICFFTSCYEIFMKSKPVYDLILIIISFLQ